MSILRTISTSVGKLIQRYKTKSIIARYGSMEVYRSHTDPLVRWNAWDIQGFYHGYRYVHVIRDYSHVVYTDPKLMASWCVENLGSGYRYDCHRVRDDGRYDELSGGDVYAVAFESQDDAALFMLRWG